MERIGRRREVKISDQPSAKWLPALRARLADRADMESAPTMERYRAAQGRNDY